MPDSNSTPDSNPTQEEKTILEILHPYTNAPESPLQKTGNTYSYTLYEGMGIPKSHVIKFQFIIQDNENATIEIKPALGCFLVDEGYMIVSKKKPEENPIIGSN